MSEGQGPCVMRVRGPKNVERAEKTDQTLWRFASAITKQKKCCKLTLLDLSWTSLKLCATTLNDTQQSWETLDNNVASV